MKGGAYGFVLRYEWNGLLFSVAGNECSYAFVVPSYPETSGAYIDWEIIPTDSTGKPIVPPQKKEQQDDGIDLTDSRQELNRIVDAIANSTVPIPDTKLEGLDTALRDSAAQLDVLNAASTSSTTSDAVKESAVKELEDMKTSLSAMAVQASSGQSSVGGGGGVGGDQASVATSPQTLLSSLKKQNTQAHKFILKNKLKLTEQQQDSFKAVRGLFHDYQSMVALDSIDKQEQEKDQQQINTKIKTQEALLKQQQPDDEEQEREDLISLFESQISELPTSQQQKSRLKKRVETYTAEQLKGLFQENKKDVKRAVKTIVRKQQQQIPAADAALQAQKSHKEQTQASLAAKKVATVKQQQAVSAAKTVALAKEAQAQAEAEVKASTVVVEKAQTRQKRVQQLKKTAQTAQKASLDTAGSSIQQARQLMQQKDKIKSGGNQEATETTIAGLIGVVNRAAQQARDAASKGDDDRATTLSVLSTEASTLAQQLANTIPASSPVKEDATQMAKDAVQTAAGTALIAGHIQTVQAGKQIMQQLQIAQGLKKPIPTTTAQKILRSLEQTAQVAATDAEKAAASGDTAHAQALTTVAGKANDTVQKISDVLENKQRKLSTSNSGSSTSSIGIGGFFTSLFGGGGGGGGSDDQVTKQKQQQQQMVEENPYPLVASPDDSKKMTPRARRIFPSGIPACRMTNNKIKDSILKLGGDFDQIKGKEYKDKNEYLKGLAYGSVRPSKQISRQQFQSSETIPPKSWDDRMKKNCRYFYDNKINPFNPSGRKTRPVPGNYTHEVLTYLCEDPRVFCDRLSPTSRDYKRYCAI